MISVVREYLSGYTGIKTECKWLLFFYMIQCISAGIAFFIAIYLDKHLNFSAQTIGFIVTVFAGGNLLGSLLAAKISDRLNPFKISSCMIVIQGACFLIVSLFSSPEVIAAAMFFLGVSGYAFAANNDFLITSLAGKTKQARSKALSLINVTSNIGVGIGGGCVSFFSKSYSFELLFSVGVMLLAIAIYYGLIAHNLLDVNEKEDEEIEEERGSGRTYYFFSLFTIFVLGLIFAQQRVSYSIYLDTYFDESSASTLLMLNSLLIIFFLPTINKLTINFNSFLLMGIGGILLGGGMSVYQYTDLFPLVLLICVVTTIGEMLGTLISQLVCFQSAPENMKGKAMGLYKFLYATGTMIGTSAGGSIQTYLGMNMVWTLCGVLGSTLFLCSLVASSFSKKQNVCHERVEYNL